ncbi:MAG: transglutaminaseTgpA domain-containing protein [Acidimicrobiales bacterium]
MDAAGRARVPGHPDATGRSGIGLVEMIRRANAPLPPEHSVTFRIATVVAVLTGILSCAAVGEVSVSSAVFASVGTVAGMVFSYLTRAKPWQWVKILLAVAVLGIFASFVLQILGAAQVGQLSSIEVPLAGLFTWVQLIHSFDVPARRDLLFSLAAAGALVTLGAAQAVSVGFLAYVAVWLGACLVGLGCSWRSMTGGVGPIALGSIAATGLVIVLTGAGFLVLLPAPRATQLITLPASLTSYLPLRDPGGITGTGDQSTEPAQPGKASGTTGVGGYLGFATELDIAVRGALGNEVIMRVRADRPGYFLGMTYDTWDGRNWKRSPPTARIVQLTTGSPFDVSSVLSSFDQAQGQMGGGMVPGLYGDELGSGPANIQTFYVAQPIANLLFATPDPTEVYFPEHSLIVGADDSMRSTIAMTPGTVYTVVSTDTALAPSVLAKARPLQSSQMPAALGPDLELPPGRYERVAALARQIVTAARATTTYAKVTALEAWMGRHLRYSTDIPPLLAGQDAVNQFLFGSRVGYCEQISTSLAVMLRTLGVPTREAIGYVPGPFDPLSDLYEIQAKDAHAWVQVWFPEVGWQNFDPTAQVPLAPPDPGAVLLSDLGHTIANLPWAPIGGGLGAIATGALVALEVRRRRRRPTGWVGRVTAELERRGAAAGLRRWPTETLGEYASRLGTFDRWRAGPTATAPLRAASALLERAAYGYYEPDAGTRAFVEDVVRGLHPARGFRRRSARRRLTTA